MASSSRIIPHLLEPYLRTTEPTPGAAVTDDREPNLAIATSVLGASTNWLILRYLYAFLKQQPSQTHQQRESKSESAAAGQDDKATATNVVLVSFLRDYTFLKENSGRIGLDLDSLTRAGRFRYVDGLSVDLFHLNGQPGRSDGAEGNTRGSLPLTGVGAGSAAGLGGGRLPGVLPPRPNPIVPGRQLPGAIRGAPSSPRGPVPVLDDGGRIPPAAGPASPKSNAPSASETSSLANPTISHLRRVLSDAVEKVGRNSTIGKKSKLVLIIDQLDFLLAAAGGDISSLSLRDLLLDLRETAEITILTLSADQPLIDEQMTTLEKEHANFVLSLLHEAGLVLSLRLLDTGVAKDVSGVIRITAGGGAGGAVEENEYLYHVRGDGSVRVFERGQ